MFKTLTLLSFVVAQALSQQAGTLVPEIHPALPAQHCTKIGCKAVNTSLTLDANFRWLHNTAGFTNCYASGRFDATFCPDAVTCAKNCAFDGANYDATYGVNTTGNAVTLRWQTIANGSRTYLLQSDTQYQLLKLLNQEFTFDVDVSALPCGLRGGAALSAMDADGGMGRFPANAAGAKFGTGYCAAACPRDQLFVDGQANEVGFATGTYGACCTDVDVWQASAGAASVAAHPCNVTSETRCSGAQCASFCAKDGCTSALSAKAAVDMRGPFTVVTQFRAPQGVLSEIRQFYVQHGRRVPGPITENALTDASCTAQGKALGSRSNFVAKGGLTQVGAALGRGMVLAFLLSNDPAASCGVNTSADYTGAQVTFSNIRWGDLETTFVAY